MAQLFRHRRIQKRGTPRLFSPPWRRAALLATATALAAAACAQPPAPPAGNPAAVDPGQLTLQLFMTMNWPALPGSRGIPNPDGKFGQSASTVFETLKNVSEIYLPAGAAPTPWATVSELPAGITPPTLQQLQSAYGVTDSPWLHFLSQNRMIDGQQVVDANSAVIRYDVRCNQQEFNYVVSNPAGYALYTLQGQEQALAAGSFAFALPAQALEVKAAWRVLGPSDDDSRYWTAYGAYLDDNQNIAYAKIGLTAFHFVLNASGGWTFMTYEQVDDPTATFKYFMGKKGGAVGENKTVNPAAAALNKQLQVQAQGTKWQYYTIIGWQTAETGAGGKPVILANMNIETYFPQTSSCMSCHAMANIGPLNHVRLDMWDYAGGNIQGRVGTIDFAAIAKKMDPADTFKQMDFTWSLREAQTTSPAK
jgi:hypothetical protein